MKKIISDLICIKCKKNKKLKLLKKILFCNRHDACLLFANKKKPVKQKRRERACVEHAPAPNARSRPRPQPPSRLRMTLRSPAPHPPQSPRVAFLSSHHRRMRCSANRSKSRGGQATGPQSQWR